MALTSTLFTGLSGLVVNQTELNVVGNNIANANTTGFKSGQAEFTPQFYVTDNPGSPISGTSGGSNPSQEGLGAQVASIETNFTAGSLQATGIQSDLAIDGAGFFVVNAGTNGQFYTRDGTFSLNSANQLVNSAGDFVQGYSVDKNFQIVGGALQNLTVPLGTSTIAKATQNASLAGNLNSGGVVATSGTQFLSQPLQDAVNGTVSGGTFLTDLENVSDSSTLYSVGDTITVGATQDGRTLPSQTYTVTGASTVQNLEDFFQSALAIDPSSAPLPNSTAGVAIVSNGGGQAIQITGDPGLENSLSISGTAISSTNTAHTNALSLTNTASATGESSNTTITAFDSLGHPISLNVNTVLVSPGAQGPPATGTVWNFYVSSPDNLSGTPVLGSGTLTFDTSGQLAAVTGNSITVDRAGTGANPNQVINLDFSATQALTGTQPSSLVSPTQDGFPLGTLDNYSIGTDGTITGSYTNGLTETIGQVAVANFNNPDGLINQGSNLYQAGAASGSAIITTPGLQGTGVIRAGELESSNVDLSKEFINLIIASTGYSASSKVISTSDELLQELLNSQH